MKKQTKKTCNILELIQNLQYGLQDGYFSKRYVLTLLLLLLLGNV